METWDEMKNPSYIHVIDHKINNVFLLSTLFKFLPSTTKFQSFRDASPM